MIIWCSNCGKRENINISRLSDLYSLFGKGYRSVGSAIYCPNCAENWKVLNQVDFDSSHKEPFKMFLEWYIQEVDNK